MYDTISNPYLKGTGLYDTILNLHRKVTRLQEKNAYIILTAWVQVSTIQTLIFTEGVYSSTRYKKRGPDCKGTVLHDTIMNLHQTGIMMDDTNMNLHRMGTVLHDTNSNPWP